MSIYKSAVNNPIKTTLAFVAIMIFGLYSLSRLPIDFYPKMDLPMISVVTTYSGANAADVETNVTKPLEDALNSIQGLKELTSTSQDNSSIITLQFEWGVNLDESMNDIRGAIDMALGRLPDGIERPFGGKIQYQQYAYSDVHHHGQRELCRVVETHHRENYQPVEPCGWNRVGIYDRRPQTENLYRHRPEPVGCLPHFARTDQQCHFGREPEYAFG
jgi:Cation/multidrug efflux pump